MILLFYCFAFLASVMGEGCEVGWFENPKAGICYNITMGGKYWTEAKMQCNEQNADLASFMSAEENKFIMDYFRNRTDGVRPNRTWADSIEYLWIGASDIDQTLGSFVWTDGSKLNFTNWLQEKGEKARYWPQSYNVSSCVVMLPKDANGQWVNVKDCDTRQEDALAFCQKPAVYNCGEGWTKDPATGSCFQILSEELSWDEAREQCISLEKGSELASIHTEQENEFVKSLLRENDNSPGVQGFWIGGNDIKEEGSWVWTDGSPVEFADWHNGQGKPTKNKDCIAMWKSFDYEWKDWQCKLTLPSVCKIENKK